MKSKKYSWEVETLFLGSALSRFQAHLKIQGKFSEFKEFLMSG